MDIPNLLLADFFHEWNKHFQSTIFFLKLTTADLAIIAGEAWDSWDVSNKNRTDSESIFKYILMYVN